MKYIGDGWLKYIGEGWLKYIGEGWFGEGWFEYLAGTLVLGHTINTGRTRSPAYIHSPYPRRVAENALRVVLENQ